MEKIFIYKFRDEIDFNTAYVIAPFGQPGKANRMIREVTSLKVHIVDTRPVEDFPLAKEHYDNNGEGIWKNSIEPF